MIFGHTTACETTFLTEWHSLGNSVLEKYGEWAVLKQLENKLCLSTFSMQPTSE